ncbi:ShlB/FhaC/HecB family hemolysin secretion/activation protein, partial [Uliginosibacterium sp. sgz301328]|uniref:ShlB/FhaC/HecB family hemolysin secretion/activation protein n=1 Tax=Uliginosibacterium sp. sgz301328 TaxID=3243764 RepID=UPI00359D354B
KHARAWAVGSGLVLSCASVMAQVPNLPGIDAREQQLQQERERALREQQEQRPDVRLQPAASASDIRIPASESPCFRIDRVELVGDASEAFQWAIEAADEPADPARGRCLGTTGINIVMARIQNAIVKRGYVTTRVLAGNQDLQTGVLRLTLVPGRVHAVRFADGVEADWVTALNAVPAKPGDLLNLRDIEQGLENFKRVPTVEADIQIVPTEGADAAAGQSDLVISWRQARRWRLSLSADDAGSRGTGKYQGTATVSLDNLFTVNDLFYVSYNHALTPFNSNGRNTDGYNAYYSIPFGYWQVTSTYSDSNYYQTVAGAYQDYRYSGRSSNFDVKLSRLIWRDATSKTTVGAKVWQRTSSNYIDDTEVEVQRRRTAGWGAEISHRHFIGAATLDMTFDYRKGTGAFDALPAPEEAFGEGSSRMRLWSFNASLDIPFTLADQRLRYSTTWRQQWNGTPLSSQDRLSLGNRYTIRGFDGELTLMGERGFVWRNELSAAIPAIGAEAYWGVDYGRVFGFPTADQLGQSLAGTALGLRGSVVRIGYDVFIGAPLYKPRGFVTANPVVGFNLNWSY